jgi:hypothetical protein
MPFAGVEPLFGSSQPLAVFVGSQKHTFFYLNHYFWTTFRYCAVLTNVYSCFMTLGGSRLRDICSPLRCDFVNLGKVACDMPNDRIALISKGKQDCFVLKMKPIRSVRNVGHHWSHSGGLNPQQQHCQNPTSLTHSLTHSRLSCRQLLLYRNCSNSKCDVACKL